MRRLRVAMVAPVAQGVPPARSGSVESVTGLLTDGLVARGHDVTLFATATSATQARLHATYPRGYHDDTSMWPWELCELLNLAAAAERAGAFDLIHYQAEYTPMGLPMPGPWPLRCCRRCTTRRAHPRSRSGPGIRRRRSSPCHGRRHGCWPG